MAETAWQALSIRQPWVNMILSGQKTLEVREWPNPPRLRGTFVIHAARAYDWKTIALLNIEPEFGAARGAFVGTADLVDVIELSASANWRELLEQHRVIHPPTLHRTLWGLVLENARPFERPLRALGRTNFFTVHDRAAADLAPQLRAHS